MKDVVRRRAAATGLALVWLTGAVGVAVALEGRPTGGWGHDNDIGVVATWIGGRVQRIVTAVGLDWDPRMPASAWIALLAAAVAVVASTVAMVHVASSPSWTLRLGTTATSLLALWAFVAVAPGLLPPEVATEAAGRWIYLPFVVFGAYASAKVLFLYRAASHFVHEPPRDPVLLSHQQAVFDLLRISPLVDDPSAEAEFRLHQVTGEWGSGKSEVLQKVVASTYASPRAWLALRRTQRDQVACVAIDIWQHDAEGDLHRAIVGSLLDHPACVLPWGWVRYPVFSTLASYLRSSAVDLPFMGSQVQVSVPRLTWQRPFERAAARCLARGARVILVLDEVDRASHEVAQAALALVHRSLDRPGVAAIVVHVPDMLDEKAFNPLMTVMADLQATAAAAISVEAQRAGILWARTAQGAAGGGATGQPERPRDVASAKVQAYDEAVATYLALPGPAQRRVVRNLREKFLSSSDHRLRPPLPADVIAMLAWPAVAASFGPVSGIDVTSGAPPPDLVVEIERWQRRTLTNAVHSAVQVTHRDIPPVRPVKNALERTFTDLTAVIGPGEQLTWPEVKAAVLLALESCAAHEDDGGPR